MARPTAPEPSLLGLKQARLLQGLPPAALEALARELRWKRFAAGQQVISRDAPDNDVYLVIAGRVRVTVFSAAGRQVTFGELGAGDWFGDFAAIDGSARSANVVAMEDALLASMAPKLFRRLMQEHPAIGDRVLLRLVKAVRELTERVFDYSTLGVRQRLLAELLRLAREAGIEGNRSCLDPAPKHADIAGNIGTYREQVTRELSAVAKQGLIQRAGSTLRIPDVERLERVVAGMRRSS